MYVIVVSQLAGDPNNLDNNGFAATEVTNALADLRVTSVVPAAPATPALSGEKTSVTYSVENQGGPVWSGTQYWTDDIWISDRKSVVSGTSVSVRVDLGGRRIIKKKNKNKTTEKLA